MGNSNEGDDHARRPADVGPTNEAVPLGIRDDPTPGESDSSVTAETEDDGETAGTVDAGELDWGPSVRTVLAGIVFIAVGTYFALGQPDPDGGLARIVVLVGLGVALYGFITWPRSRNVS